ncbi:hypothetical protein EKG38_17485 [Shewanella canadensis]|uniref:Uncharacterized protein n=1 Tax=Shewanella canadensis TaxID=271096 RepID=A0A431WQ42_9GAMM|nr:hypothetical protein [Shewanella canadensis]RTR37531.1 hypothetical protein EKG38_17485 [Shewanella canadensis]
MKIIRFLYRQMNLNTTGKHRARIRKTLVHSLRILTEKKSGPEWDESLSGGNLLWFQNKCRPLDDYTPEQKQVVFDTIVPPKQITNMSRVKTKRRQYKAKIQNAIKVERMHGHDDAADLLWDLIGISDDVHIKEIKLAEFEMMTMNRHKQRIEMVKTFIKAHNKLIDSRPNKNATYVQEGILKIPHRWQVGSDIVSPQDFIDFTNAFLTHHFPNYPIHALVVHTDEREKKELTGAHCHYFLSGQETVFGNWDLLKTQVEVVNQYQREKNKRLAAVAEATGEVSAKTNIEDEEAAGADSEGEAEEELLPENCILTLEQSAIHGERFQRMFFDFVNDNLLNDKGLNAEIAPESERKSEERKILNRDAKKTKSERPYNYATRSIELKEKRLAHIQNQIVEQHQELENVQLNIDRQKIQGQQELDAKQVAKDSLTNDVKQLETEIENKLETKFVNYLSELCSAIYARTKALNKGNDALAAKFAKNIVTKIHGASTPELEQACIQVLNIAGDDVLLNEYDSSNDTSPNEVSPEVV